jgi:hypothetical protein
MIYQFEKFMPHSVPVWMLADWFAEHNGFPPVGRQPLLDWNKYRDEQRKGRVLFVAARNQELDLVGFALLFLVNARKYVPESGIRYVLPKFRDQGVEEAIDLMIEGKLNEAARA